MKFTTKQLDLIIALHGDKKLRFAPSPTGYLHLGHIASCAILFEVAKQVRGKVYLRLEDHDRQRSKDEFARAICEDLNWLGFKFENDPQTPNSPFKQSNRNKRYDEALALLQQNGLIYFCDCSRKKIINRTQHQPNTDLAYDGFCRNKQKSFEPGKTAVRIRVEERTFSFDDLFLGRQSQSPADQIGDFTIKDRKDNWTYQFSSVIDDIDQHMNLIVRGMDILPSTGRQLFLRELLHCQDPILFAHHPLVKDDAGEKLSKRFESTSIRALKAEGMTAVDIKKLALKLIS